MRINKRYQDIKKIIKKTPPHLAFIHVWPYQLPAKAEIIVFLCDLP